MIHSDANGSPGGGEKKGEKPRLSLGYQTTLCRRRREQPLCSKKKTEGDVYVLYFKRSRREGIPRSRIAGISERRGDYEGRPTKGGKKPGARASSNEKTVEPPRAKKKPLDQKKN